MDVERNIAMTNFIRNIIIRLLKFVIYLYSGFVTIANCHQPFILAIGTGP